MKRWIDSRATQRSIVVALALAAMAAQGSEQGTVLKNRSNVRARPSTTAEVITQLKQGDAVDVIEHKSVTEGGKTRDWLRIALPATAKCYVASKLLQDGVVTGDAVNIRSGPGTNYRELGKLAKGDRVEVTGTKGDWTEIKPTENCSAWIAGELVEVQAAAAAEPPASAAPAPIAPEVTTPPVAAPSTSAMPAAPAISIVSTDPDVITRYVVRDGVLRAVAEGAQAPGAYELVTLPVDRLQHRICYVEVPELQIEKYVNKRVRVFGNERWRRGDRWPVLAADRVDRAW
jgi:uncharacterized protein YgiM (DUF1202 family)